MTVKEARELVSRIEVLLVHHRNAQYQFKDGVITITLEPRGGHALTAGPDGRLRDSWSKEEDVELPFPKKETLGDV